MEYRGGPSAAYKRYRSSPHGRAKMHEYEQRPETRRRRMLAHAKYRAKERGLAFSITLEDVVIPDICPLLGVPLNFGVGEHHDGSPSLDRKDSSKGYVRGNVWVISRRANVIKNDATTAELRRLVKGLDECCIR
jgi:hypothetical protein